MDGLGQNNIGSGLKRGKNLVFKFKRKEGLVSAFHLGKSYKDLFLWTHHNSHSHAAVVIAVPEARLLYGPTRANTGLSCLIG